jgi:hypothetical protein
MENIGQHGGAHYVSYLTFAHAGAELVNHVLINHVALLDVHDIDAW